jgi:RNA polymerase sigma-70 factor (ECF subfamily)
MMGKPQATPTHLDEEGAFADCFQQYKNMVYKTALLLLDSAEDAEDALQEVFMQVHRSRHTFDPTKGALSTWIYRITVNHCTSRRRKSAWRSWITNRFGNGASPQHVPSPEERLGDTAVRVATQQLSDKLRTILILRFYNELPYEEIAEILEIPVGTAKSRVNFALVSLRQKLQGNEQSMRLMKSQEIIP